MLLKRSKKGLAPEFIVGTMITLIAFFLIGVMLMRFTSHTSDKEAELLCQNSIAIRAQSAVQIKGSAADIQAKLVPPLCRTIDKKVSGSREQILRQMSDKMAKCWEMFGEGRYEELLDNFELDVLPVVLGFEDAGPNQCFNCYTILIDEDEIEGGPIPAQEINDFLLKEKYAKFNVSYLEYIQGHGGPGRVVFTAPEIFPNQAYTISMMPKNKEDSTFWKGVFQQAGGAALLGGPTAGILSIVAFGVGEGIKSAVQEEKAPGLPPATGKAVPIVLGALAGGTALYLQHAGYMNIMADAYKERDVSSIYVGFLEVGQEMCGSGDIAGQ